MMLRICILALNTSEHGTVLHVSISLCVSGYRVEGKNTNSPIYPTSSKCMSLYFFSAVSKPLEIANLIKNKFGSAENITGTSPGIGSSKYSPNFTFSQALQHRCTIWQKTHLYRLNLDSECMHMCFLLSNNSIFPCKNLNLWIFYTELRLSLYKCIFCKMVQQCWGDSKLDYCAIQCRESACQVARGNAD